MLDSSQEFSETKNSIDIIDTTYHIPINKRMIPFIPLQS